MKIFHCIDANGFDSGRDEFVSDIVARPTGWFGTRPEYQKFLGTTTATPKAHEYPSGSGSDGVPYSGDIVVLSVAFPKA